MEPFEGLGQVLKPSLETAQFLHDLEAALEQEREDEHAHGTYVPIFMPPEPLPCPDCNEPRTIFYDHCLVGWLCQGCFVRVQAACEGLARYKAPRGRSATGTAALPRV